MDGWRSRRSSTMLAESVLICGESGDVSGETVESWKERLPELVRAYNKEDIIMEHGWNWLFLEGTSG